MIEHTAGPIVYITVDSDSSSMAKTVVPIIGLEKAQRHLGEVILVANKKFIVFFQKVASVAVPVRIKSCCYLGRITANIKKKSIEAATHAQQCTMRIQDKALLVPLLASLSCSVGGTDPVVHSHLTDSRRTSSLLQEDRQQTQLMPVSRQRPTRGTRGTKYRSRRRRQQEQDVSNPSLRKRKKEGSRSDVRSTL